jgi:hypothetical protein
VCREKIQGYLKLTVPDQVAGRLAKRFVRRTFYAAGINHFWAMDQHDKWKQFGLFWHGCLDGFTGKILWLVVWWTNSNPWFVCTQYLKAIKNFSGTLPLFFIIGLSSIFIGAPCITQSDHGTENFNVTYAHTHLHHQLDPSLSGSIQHQWMHGHSNIRPEQMWSQFHRMWVPGFENLLQEGIRQQWYHDINVADRYITCHICIGLKTYKTL